MLKKFLVVGVVLTSKEVFLGNRLAIGVDIADGDDLHSRLFARLSVGAAHVESTTVSDDADLNLFVCHSGEEFTSGRGSNHETSPA